MFDQLLDKRQKTDATDKKRLISSKFVSIIFEAIILLFFLASVFLFKEEAVKIGPILALALSQTADVLDLSGLIQVLSAISSIAVILGVVFIIVQLRQNAKLIDLNTKLTGATFRDVNRTSPLKYLRD